MGRLVVMQTSPISRPGTVTSLRFSPLVGDGQDDGAHIVSKDGSVVARHGSSRKEQQACLSARGIFAPTTTSEVDPVTSELSSFFDVRKWWPGRDDRRLRHTAAVPRTRASADTPFRLDFISSAQNLARTRGVISQGGLSLRSPQLHR